MGRKSARKPPRRLTPRIAARPRLPAFEVYSTLVGTLTKPRREWRWRLRAANGRVVANGGESFTRKSHATGYIDLLWDALKKARVVLL